MESLYERLGGTDRITAIAGDLFELHLANPRISPRYAESDPAQVKNAVATYFIGVTGGPDDYEGKDMLPAHRGMNIGAA